MTSNRETYDFVDSKDGPDRDTTINVGASVEGIKDDTVLAPVLIFDENSVLVLLRDHDRHLVGRSKCIHKDLVRNDIQFFLVFALNVRGVGKAGPIRRGEQKERDEFNCNMAASQSLAYRTRTYMLIKLALRTLEATNLQPSWMAVSSRVRSPEASL